MNSITFIENKQAKDRYHFQNIKEKLNKTNAWIWLNKTYVEIIISPRIVFTYCAICSYCTVHCELMGGNEYLKIWRKVTAVTGCLKEYLVTACSNHFTLITFVCYSVNDLVEICVEDPRLGNLIECALTVCDTWVFMWNTLSRCRGDTTFKSAYLHKFQAHRTRMPKLEFSSTGFSHVTSLSVDIKCLHFASLM